MASSKKTTTTYNATGIDLDGISKINSAISSFQGKINKYVDTATNIDSTILSHAMKGPGVQQQFKASENAVKVASKNIVSKLNQFQSVLQGQVKNSYNNTVQTVAKSSFSQAQSIK